MRRKKKESARPIHVCGSLKQGEGRGKMKKLIYLVLSVLCGISGIYGIYDAITTPKHDLATSIITILLLAFLAWFFWHLFLKPEPRHKHQAENAPESSPEATSDAPTVETAPITHADTNDGVEDDYVAIDKALPKFYAFCGRDAWIGHNIRRFDLPVIAREAQMVGAGMPDVSFYDTMELSQALLPQLDHHRVVDLIRYFGIAKTERHRAADDAAQTAQIFECLKRI